MRSRNVSMVGGKTCGDGRTLLLPRALEGAATLARLFGLGLISSSSLLFAMLMTSTCVVNVRERKDDYAGHLPCASMRWMPSRCLIVGGAASCRRCRRCRR